MQVQKLLSERTSQNNIFPLLRHVKGNDTHIDRVTSPANGRQGDLIFVWDRAGLDLALRANPSAIIISDQFRQDEINQFPVIYSSSNPRLVYALIYKYLRHKDSSSQKNHVHPSAIIADDVEVPPTTSIGPGVIIGSQSVIGDYCRIDANTVLGEGVSIGSHTQIEPQCYLGDDTQIGSHVTIQVGAVIGSSGFGFAQDDQANFFPIPHLGRVVIEDDVQIGSNCCIDRAVFDETTIGRGTKLDNLCHVAHNVTIGKSCIITAGFCSAGSVKVGDRVMTSGQTGVMPHITIGNDVHLTMRAGVIDSIKEPGTYAGLPAQPIKEYMKNTAVSRKLAPLRKTIRRLESRVLGESGDA